MKINLTTPINEMGYGVAGLNIYRALVKTGHEVALFPIGGEQNIKAPPEAMPVINQGLERAKLFDHDAPSVRIWHQFDMSQHVGRGPKVGFPFFELDRFTPQEVHHLSSLDKILVTCEWAKSIVRKHKELAHIPVSIVPLGVDRSIFRPKKATRADLFGRSTTSFLTVGKWEIRKGHDVLIECFDRAFEEHDDVELLLLTNNPFLVGPAEAVKQQWLKKCRSAKLASKIHILPRAKNHQEVADLMKQADAGVFLSRGEAWNLELLEMMACAKPVIVTDCTAHSSYCNVTNARMVPTFGTEPAFDGVWFHNQGEWAKITEQSKEVVIKHMRDIHDLKLRAKTMYSEAAFETARELSWEKAASRMVHALESWQPRGILD